MCVGWNVVFGHTTPRPSLSAGVSGFLTLRPRHSPVTPLICCTYGAPTVQDGERTKLSIKIQSGTDVWDELPENPRRDGLKGEIMESFRKFTRVIC